VETHALAPLIKAAEKTHLESHKKMGLWFQISKNNPRAKHQQIIGCMWVYVYKTDKHGRFVKIKARLMIRDNQQQIDQNEETYAATLAGRSFRTLIAIAACFDLKCCNITSLMHSYMQNLTKMCL
jgi:hypothetical protein